MLTIEIRAGETAKTLPLRGRMTLGAEHGIAEGALELEARGDAAVATCRTHDAQIGQQRLPAGVRRLLRAGDALQLGDAAITLRVELDDAPATRLLAQAMLRGEQAPARPGIPSLLWLNGPDLGKRVVLMEEATFIGRGEGCVGRINDAQASRMHAKVVRGPDGYRLIDLMSANGVLVEGERVTGARPLQGGEVIQIGGTLMAFERPAEAARPRPPPPPSSAAQAPSPAPANAARAPSSTAAERPISAKPPKKLERIELALVGVAGFAVVATAAVMVWALH